MYDELVSVIIPVYNVEEYLRRCINSVIGQTYKNLEIILIDDGSTDSSGKICDEYVNIDNRVLIVHKDNEGLSSARNCGIDLASGKYISFVDSDDFVDSKMMEVLLNNMIIADADISVGSYVMFTDEKKISGVCRDNVFSYCDSIEAQNRLFSNRMPFSSTIACDKLYRKTLFDNNRYAVGKIHEDEMIIHHLLFEANKIVYTKFTIYYYFRGRSESIIQNYCLKRLDILDAYVDRMEFYQQKNLYELFMKSLYRYLFTIRQNYGAIKKYLPNEKKTLLYLRYRHIEAEKRYRCKHVAGTIFDLCPKVYLLVNRLIKVFVKDYIWE